MKDDVFDPYDISNYSNPMNQHSTEKETDDNTIEEKDNNSKVKNVFNPYEDNNNNDEDKLDDNDE